MPAKNQKELLKELSALKMDKVLMMKESNNRLRMLTSVFMDATDPIIIEDPFSNIIDMNRQAELSYGWAREELLGKTIKTIIPDHRHLEADQLLTKCLNGDPIRNIQGMRKHKNGKLSPILLTLSLLTDENDNAVGVATIAKDISEIIESKKRLMASEERYKYIFNSASVPIVEMDFSNLRNRMINNHDTPLTDQENPESLKKYIASKINMLKIINFNQQCYTLFQTEDENILNHHLNKMLEQNSHQLISQFYNSLKDESFVFECETTITDQNGDQKAIILSVTVPEENTSMEKVLISLIDISNQKELEKELIKENKLLKEKILSVELKHPDAFTEIISTDSNIHSLFYYMEAIACTNEPVLVTGETGTGKELIAKAFYKLEQYTGKFVTINVAGLDDHMFSDTIFGHLKGAYTDASRDRTGLIEKAQNGLLFLDEIGDLSLISQVKLLRLIQEQEYYPLGADEPKYSSARIIVATNQHLQNMVNQGKFRQDLYYRLNVHHIKLPPLRNRKIDIPLLTDHFLAEAAEKMNKKKPTPPEELYVLLNNYNFPGNIRELRALIYNAVSMHKSKILSLDSFQKKIYPKLEQTDQNSPLLHRVVYPEKLPTLKEWRILLINEALVRSANNQTLAAKMLGIGRTALNKWLKSELKKEKE